MEIISSYVKEGIDIVLREENMVYIKGGDFSVRKYPANRYNFRANIYLGKMRLMLMQRRGKTRLMIIYCITHYRKIGNYV